MSEKEMADIVAKIRQRREELGLSYQDLADRTGISKSTIQRYEKGFIKKVPVNKLEVIARALQVEPSFLMGWKDAPAPEEEKMDSRSRKQLKKFIDELEGAFEGGISTMTDDERAAVMEMMTDVFKFVKKANKRKK